MVDMKPATTLDALPVTAAEEISAFGAVVPPPSREIAVLKAELARAKNELSSVLEGARAAFSASDSILELLSGAPAVAEVSGPLLEVLCEWFEFEVATFWRFDLSDGKLFALAHRFAPCYAGEQLAEAIQSLRAPLDEGVAGRVFVERCELISGDAIASAHPLLAPLLEASGLHSVCAFPLIGSNAPLGVIEMERREPFELDHAIAPAVRMIGARIAAFMELTDMRERYLALAAGGDSGAECLGEESAKVVRLRRAA
jgi:hypothetical protein